ncbi:MAG TPA: hypothetical protein VE130_09890 [Nitrososphaeraceae archaeon]|nr:hypothetical protein [Nitrososphaeraceae archaeon]
MIKPNLAYDLLQSNKLSSNTANIKKRDNDGILQPIDRIYFVICNSCYWCASYFSIDDLDSSLQVLSCHLCNSHNTEVIPISSNESFRIDYSVTRGTEIEFYRGNQIVDRKESPEQQIVLPD